MAYTTGGWLSRRRGQRQEESNLVDGRCNGTALPDDILALVFTRFTDAADVLRCAATCRRWCRVVAKEAAVLARVFPPEFARRRAVLGLVHQPDYFGVTAARKRKRDSGSSSSGTGQPCFVPTAAASRLLGFRSPSVSLSDGGRHGALMEHSRPVASRNGWVVLELGRQRHADGSLNVCVFNPMTGDIALLPPLSGEDRPRCYACALLTADDDLRDAPASGATFFFRVLIVYNRYRFTALRAYSSDTNRWGAEVAISAGPKIDNVRLRKLGQGVVLRGVAYWPLRRSALAVRLDGPQPSEVTMSPDGIPADQPQHLRLLGVTRDRKQQQVCFIDARFGFDSHLHRAGQPCHTIFLMTKVLRTVDGEDEYGGMSTSKWVRQEGIIELPGTMMVHSPDAVKLRWFCEKSGVILFTVGEYSDSPGAYALDVSTHKVEKVADGAGCDSWRNVVGWEMGAAAYLASVACY